MRPLYASFATMLLAGILIFTSQNLANASSVALTVISTSTVEPGLMPTKTSTLPPFTINPGSIYVHSSGLFSFQLPSDSWFDPAFPPETVAPRPDYDYTRVGQMAFLPCTTIHFTVERFHSLSLRTVDDLNRAFDHPYFVSVWGYYGNAWKELQRRTDGRRLVIDFELHDKICGDQLARQVSRRYDDWLATVRFIVPRDNPSRLDDLVKLIWPSLMTYDDALKTPLNWSASIDPTTGYILKYPADAVILSDHPGDPMAVLATVANTKLVIRARGAQSKAVYSETEARAWVTAQHPDARILLVTPDTRSNAAGFSVVYTLPGSEGSGLAVLLNGKNGTLYSAEFSSDSSNFSLLQTTDLSAVSDLFNVRFALIVIPPTRINTLGTLWLLPSSTPAVEASPTLASTSTPVSAGPTIRLNEPPSARIGRDRFPGN